MSRVFAYSAVQLLYSGPRREETGEASGSWTGAKSGAARVGASGPSLRGGSAGSEEAKGSIQKIASLLESEVGPRADLVSDAIARVGRATAGEVR